MTFKKRELRQPQVDGLYEKYFIDVCCQRLADEEEIAFWASMWNCYGDGVIQIANIKHCPFCGEKLP